MSKTNNSNQKKSFIEELMEYTKEDIERIISERGKPPKLIVPAFIIRK